MNERQQWNVEEIASILHAEKVRFKDEYGDDSYRFLLKDVVDPKLEGRLVLTPETLLVRYRSPLYEAIMPNVTSISPDQDYLRIISVAENVQKQLFINAKGSLIFNMAAVEEPVENGLPREQLEKVKQEPAPTQVEIQTQGDPKEEPKEEEAKKPERVTLTGRVGKLLEPQKYTNGSVAFKLPLAVRTGDEDKPNWYTVYFYNERAKKAAEIVHTGQLVTVVAYKHEGGLETKTGIKKDKYIGAVVQPPKKA